MALIKGILKSKAGDELRPLTSTDQVELEEGGKRLDAWIDEIDLSVENALAIIDEDGKVKSTALPDIVNKFKGTFANEAALPETGEAGDYAICTDTDTVWVWDAEKEGGEGWIDTGKKGSVSSVNGKTGDVVIEISDIDGLQTAINAKVNTADIVNNLTSEETDKPLSAAQGKALSDLVTTAQTTANSAATTAAEIDFAIVENGAAAPTNLREAGIYFEKDATGG